MSWLKRQIAKVRYSWDTYWVEHEESFEEYYYNYYINEVNNI